MYFKLRVTPKQSTIDYRLFDKAYTLDFLELTIAKVARARHEFSLRHGNDVISRRAILRCSTRYPDFSLTY